MVSIGYAFTFLESFPEAKAWHLTVLDKRKISINNEKTMSTQKLRLALPHMLGLSNVHVFVRPLLSNLVFVDLDDFATHSKDL